MVKISHRRAKCIGCNACVEADKYRWRMSRKDGKSTLVGGKAEKGIYRGEFEDEEYKTIVRAVKNCPVKIIQMESRSIFSYPIGLNRVRKLIFRRTNLHNEQLKSGDTSLISCYRKNDPAEHELHYFFGSNSSTTLEPLSS